MQSQTVLDELKTKFAAAEETMPLHKRLRLTVEILITENLLKPGAALPGERLIAEALGISRVTVRKSIDSLVDDGYLRRRHGARTEVASRVEKSLSTLTSFTEDMAARGLKAGCLWLSRQVLRPSPAEMMALGVSADSKVVRMERIRTADDVPIAIERSVVPTRFLPSPSLVGDSLYSALDRLGAMPQRAIQRMRSRPASEVDAEHLDCAPGAPLLIMERRCFLQDDQIVEFSETRYRGDVYDFVFELKR